MTQGGHQVDFLINESIIVQIVFEFLMVNGSTSVASYTMHCLGMVLVSIHLLFLLLLLVVMLQA